MAFAPVGSGMNPFCSVVPLITAYFAPSGLYTICV
jgi:hypothetical protein